MNLHNKIKEKDNQISQLENKKNELETFNSKMNEEKKLLNEKITELELKNADFNNKNIYLDNKIKEYNTTNEGLLKEILEKAKEIEGSKSSNEEKNKDISNFRKQIEELSKSVDENKRKNDSIEELSKLLENAKNELLEVKKSLEEINKNKTKELNEKEQLIKSNEHQLNDMVTQLKTLNQNLTKQEEKYREQCCENKELIQKNKQLESSITTQNQQIKQYENSIKQLEFSIINLKQQVEQYEHNKKQLDTSIIDLKQQIEQYKKQLETSYQNFNQKVEENNNEVMNKKQLEFSNKILNEQLGQCQRDNIQEKKVLEDQLKRNEENIQKLNNCQQKLEILEKVKLELQDQLQKNQNYISMLQSICNKINIFEENTEELIKSLQNHLEEINKNNSLSLDIIKNFADQSINFEEEKNLLRIEIEELKFFNDTFNHFLNDQNQATKSLLLKLNEESTKFIKQIEDSESSLILNFRDIIGELVSLNKNEIDQWYSEVEAKVYSKINEMLRHYNGCPRANNNSFSIENVSNFKDNTTTTQTKYFNSQKELLYVSEFKDISEKELKLISENTDVEMVNEDDGDSDSSETCKIVENKFKINNKNTQVFENLVEHVKQILYNNNNKNNNNNNNNNNNYNNNINYKTSTIMDIVSKLKTFSDYQLFDQNNFKDIFIEATIVNSINKINDIKKQSVHHIDQYNSSLIELSNKMNMDQNELGSKFIKIQENVKKRKEEVKNQSSEIILSEKNKRSKLFLNLMIDLNIKRFESKFSFTNNKCYYSIKKSEMIKINNNVNFNDKQVTFFLPNEAFQTASSITKQFLNELSNFLTKTHSRSVTLYQNQCACGSQNQLFSCKKLNCIKCICLGCLKSKCSYNYFIYYVFFKNQFEFCLDCCKNSIDNKSCIFCDKTASDCINDLNYCKDHLNFN
ncbi:hypothetical protein ACTFIU_008490 [Dictyostelium citrinum]